MIKLSIITLCYNNPSELESTIKSIINSKLFSDYSRYLEVVVIDGSPTTICSDVIEKYCSEFCVKYFDGCDNGIYNAMNIGVEKSVGQQVVFMNSGDHFCLDFSFDSEIFFGEDFVDCLYFGDTYHCVGHEIYYSSFSSHSFQAFWWRQKLPCHQSVFVPRRFLEKYPFNESLTISADSELLFLAFKNIKNHVYLGRFVSKFNVGGVSTVPETLKNALKHAEELISTRKLKGLSRYRCYFDLFKKYIFLKLFGVENYYRLTYKRKGLERLSSEVEI